MEQEYLLEITGISKSFPGVRALHDINLKVRKGSVHALMGENGAGKSTLMKVLIGLYKPDSGVIKFDGDVVKFQVVQDALKKGIAMIHQELSPVLEMTVAENIFLGREKCYRNSFWINDREMERKTVELLRQLEISIDPKTKMKDLSTAYMQMVEIAKAISYDAKLVIMDEPTSAITEREVEHLFKIIKWLQDKGVTIIYISHKMDEIFRIADEITVFRDGELVWTSLASQTNKDNLIELMVGRELKNLFPKENCPIGDTVLEIRNFNRAKKFRDINIKVRKGEILGLAGLMGAGRTEIMESLFGIIPPDTGEVFLNNKKTIIKTPQDAVRNKIAFLTEDRKLSGLYLPLTVKDNMSIVNLNNYLKAGLINNKNVEKDCQEMVELLTIRTPGLEQEVNNLSGGNQQKVLIARWLLINSDILILDEPTRGIDVGAKAEIHKLMSRLAGQGKAVIMISSELPEILGMSDRIIVMHEGHLTGELNRDEATQEKVMRLATGLVS